MRVSYILILLAILLALGGYYYLSSRPEPAPEPEPRVFVWSVEMEELQYIEIRLSHEGKSQAFIKEADRTWHFDDPERSEVDMKRWGGGIPLLLSGPGAERVIAEDATEGKLAEFGLAEPRMEITVTLEDGTVLNIAVGDWTPDGNAFYMQVPGSDDVCLVDYTWYGVIERLVEDPPYVVPSTD
ncbi:MAG: DUF4340 domain-containing protein [Dehalococcoidia bacterium]|nr:DUF4340 domain-containing protein [Dehalococcoidia bacterium]